MTESDSKLAINGGTPTVDPDKAAALMPVATDWPRVDDADLDAIRRVLTMPPYTFYDEGIRLEEEFAAWTGSRHAIAHTNGTAALHAALFAVGVRPGDEVIVPSYTFLATCTPALACKAIPVFAEIDPKSLNLDPADVERRITARTKAIVVVHFGGAPADMDGIMAVARRHGLAVVEDVAHAHGATCGGRKAGTIGDVGCFSFQQSKLMPAMEAGMLVTDRRDVYERALALGHFERLGKLPDDSPYRQYANSGMGFKYRIHPAAAAMARKRLAEFDAVNARRNRSMDQLSERIDATAGFRTQAIPAGSRRSYYAYRVIIRSEAMGGISRERIQAALAAEGVGTGGAGYVLQHVQPIYEDARREMLAMLGRPCEPPETRLPVTEAVYEHILSLPVFHDGGLDLPEMYARAFEKVSQGWRDIPEVDQSAQSQAPEGARRQIR